MVRKTIEFIKNTIIDIDYTYNIFASLKKDRSLAEHLKYNDVFIDEKIFKWESQTNTTLDNTHGKKLIESKEAHLFVRREENEDVIVLPYTYVGVGMLSEPEVTDNPVKTLAFNLTLESPLPKDIQFEFISRVGN